MNNNNFTIEKLKGRENWSSWSFAVKAYFDLEELTSCLLDENSDEKKDKKAKSKLILLLDPQLYVHVQDAKTAKHVWENLTRAFEDSGLTRRVGLLRDLCNTTLEGCSNIEEYVNKIMTTAHKLRNIGFNVDDEWLGTLLLSGLPEMYKPMIMGIESSGIKISADLIKTKLLQEVKNNDTDTTAAFYVNSRKSHPKYNFQPTPSKGPRCFNCNKFGHLGKNCWFKKKNNNNNGFLAAFSANSAYNSSKWYLDSGASMHMTMHRDWLQDETVPPVSKIRIADDKILNVISCGNVNISVPSTKSSSNGTIQVRNVLYIPDLSINLLSLSKIIKSGCKVDFDKNGCQIYNPNGEKVAKANLVNDTYILNTYTDTDTIAMSAVSTDDPYLWHQRMGHLNMQDVNKIPNCTSGVKLTTNNNKFICIPCIKSKHTRAPFPDKGSRANDLLEIIHTDTCGPMQTISIGGARYFVTFIDDFSRKVHVYFIKNKSEVFQKFIEFKSLVENELNRKIKILRSDNGKEYVNINFNNYLKSNGIRHQTTNPYTPEQNGLSERMNRTLIERAKCMLYNAELQINYWAEATATAAYIINRSPTHSLSFKTPQEIWTGILPDLSHMRIFGCQAMVHIPKGNRRKLDVKSRKLIFVGYGECTKGYRFIDPESKKVIMSRDVIFLENTVKQNIVTSENTNLLNKNLEMENIPKKKQKEIIKNTECLKNINEIYLPLSSNVVDQKNVKTVVDAQSDAVINTSDSSNTINNIILQLDESITDSESYEDPRDETYIPDESIQSSPDCVTERRTRRDHQAIESDHPISYFCINGESTMSILDHDPQSVDEALTVNDVKWKAAMDCEYNSLIDNNTWILKDKPPDAKEIPCSWIYKTKKNRQGDIERHKARSVMKGFKQRKSMDYHEIYAPVPRQYICTSMSQPPGYKNKKIKCQ